MSYFKRLSAISIFALFLSCAGDFETIGNDKRVGVMGICNGKEYNTTLYNCVLGEIVGSCKGQSYYPEYQSCENGKIMDGAEISSSSSATQSSSSVPPGSSAQSSSSAKSSSSSVPPGSSGGTSSATPPGSSSSFVSMTPCEGATAEGTVDCDGETYSTVKIGDRIWMAKNLNYDVSGSKCYNDEPENCTLYGRLYDFVTAMGFEASCAYTGGCINQIQSPHRGICPEGWHIPSDEDWNQLFTCLPVGTQHLKAQAGWNNCGPSTGDNIYFLCADTHGFSAMPGGKRTASSNQPYKDAGSYGYWWSTSGNQQWNRSSWYISNNTESASKEQVENIANHLSVRCVKDQGD